MNFILNLFRINNINLMLIYFIIIYLNLAIINNFKINEKE